MQPIASVVQKAYDKQLVVVNSLTILYLLVSIFTNLPSNYLLDRMGCRNGIIAGLFLSLVGMWVKCLINVNFWFAILG